MILDFFEILSGPEMTTKFFSTIVIIFLFFCIHLLNNFVFSLVFKKFPEYLKKPLQILRGFLRVLVFVVGTIAILESWGVDLKALIAGFGITGFIVTFAMRDFLTSILSGALILVYRPFKVGDRIRVASVEGVVKKIDIQYTTISEKGKYYSIPNTKISSDAIVIREDKLRPSK